MFCTLKSSMENSQARIRLQEKNCSALPYNIGDWFKSWDLELAVQVLEQHCGPNAVILDIGAYCSEMCASLAMLGYKNLYAVDLNAAVLQQPFNNQVRYAVGDFYHNAAVDSSFDAITSISVIEHGYRDHALFAEVARLLRPGGIFVASYDYWPEKISTEGVVSFDMDWTIFCESEIEQMIQVASQHGLTPLTPLKDLVADEPHIRYLQYNYTFGFAAFRRQ